MSNNISTAIIVAKIKRLNIKGVSTKLYDEFDTDFKKIIDNSIDLRNDEQFILGYCFNTNYWWIITNFRLLVKENDLINNYFFDNIKSVEAKDIFEKGISNEECNSLQLTLQSGKEKSLIVENYTWFSVLNLLKFLLYKS